MRKITSFFLGLAALTLALTAIGQTRIPVYHSRQDSINVIEFERVIEKQFGGKVTSPAVADSIKNAYGNLMEKAVKGYRYVYEPTASYTPLQSLLANKINNKDVTHLSIHNFKQKKLPREIFKCDNLVRIEFIETYVNRLPRRLTRLNDLKYVSLYNNHSKKKLRLARNSNITFLKIRGSDPEKIPQSFHRLTSLDTLDLQRNMLSRFPSIAKNTNLKQLLLGENRLTLTENIEGNNSIQHLGLQRNQIERVPDAIGKFPSLKKLILNYNKISQVSNSLGDLKQLEELSFYSNKLRSIPPSVYSLPNLYFVDLYFNQIERIDDNIEQLRKLQIFYLAFNKVYAISDKIGTLQNLRELYLHHNRISYLPSTLRHVKSLSVLRVNANNLVELPEWVSELVNLKNIDISQNGIVSAPEQLKALKHLEIVAMTENKWENFAQAAALAATLQGRGVIVHLEEAGRED